MKLHPAPCAKFGAVVFVYCGVGLGTFVNVKFLGAVVSVALVSGSKFGPCWLFWRSGFPAHAPYSVDINVFLKV